MGILVTYCHSPFSGRSSFGAGSFMREEQTNHFSIKNNKFSEHGKCMKASCLIPCELKKESCLIPYGVRPETANSTHP